MPVFYLDPQRRMRGRELHRLKKWGATGIIMRELPDPDNEELIGLGLPTIISTYIREKVPGVHEIYVDNNSIGMMAARHLIELGLKRFAFCGFDDFFWSQQRLEGFQSEVAKAGLETCVYRQPSSPSQRLWDNEQLILEQWLRSLSKPIGLMACIDERAQHVIQACNAAGLKIPEEIAVIGGDNDDLLCELANPRLSSVAINGLQAGFNAAALLDRLMAGEKLKQQRVIVEPTHVAVRQSTTTLATEDTEVANALRYIREQSKNQISVDNVVDITAVGRRALEKRFREAIGRSIHDEIRRTRVEEIKKLVTETHLSVSEIASRLGFTSTSNIARFFRENTGMSFREYRRRFGLI
jgi:LacI family transcriptional regulator